jgi:transcriptional regulator with XRE-family HTH domain
MNACDISRVSDLSCRVGELIAQYRKRKSTLHNGGCWSQEGLAFAIGSSQARISQIETNQSHPQWLTLARISDALGLTEYERKELLILAGYQAEPGLPNDTEVASVLFELVPVVDSYPYPAGIIDEGERTWYWNALKFLVWGPCYRVSDRHAFDTKLKGKRPIEVLFDPEGYQIRYRAWAAYIEDIDNLITRLVAIFWRAYRIRPHDPTLIRTLSRLKQNPDFCVIWHQVQRGERNVHDLEHTTQVAHNPQIGRLQFHVWRTHPAIDSRFVVVHFTPADSSTHEALRRLVERRGA